MNPIHFGTKRRFWLFRAFGGAVMAAAHFSVTLVGLDADPAQVAELILSKCTTPS